MKKNKLKYIILALFLFQQSAYCEDSSDRDALYASFSFHPVTINSNPTYIAGGRLIYVVDERYAIGLGSFNMISRNIKANFTDTITKTRPTLEYNYFSGDFEYFFNPQDFYMFSAKTSFNLAHVRYNLISTEKSSVENYSPDYGQDWFWFVEPSALMTLNLKPWFKVSFSVGYRISINGNYTWEDIKYDNKKLSGLSGGVYFKLGNF